MLILKRTILLVLILISGIGIAQSKIPFYEQIAFDFYHNEILTKDSIQSRIRVYKEIEEKVVIQNYIPVNLCYLARIVF